MDENKNIDISELESSNSIFSKKVEKQSTLVTFVNSFFGIFAKAIKWIFSFIWSLVVSLFEFFIKVVIGAKKLVLGIGRFFKNKYLEFKDNDIYGRLSFVFFGVSSIKHHQVVNGIMYLCFEIGYIILFALYGLNSIIGLGTLGVFAGGEVCTPDDLLGEVCESSLPDNGVLWLVYGILWIFSLVAFFYIWNKSITSGYNNYRIQNFTVYRDEIQNFIPQSNAISAYINDKKIVNFKEAKLFVNANFEVKKAKDFSSLTANLDEKNLSTVNELLRQIELINSNKDFLENAKKLNDEIENLNKQLSADKDNKALEELIRKSQISLLSLENKQRKKVAKIEAKINKIILVSDLSLLNKQKADELSELNDSYNDMKSSAYEIALHMIKIKYEELIDRRKAEEKARSFVDYSLLINIKEAVRYNKTEAHLNKKISFYNAKAEARRGNRLYCLLLLLYARKVKNNTVNPQFNSVKQQQKYTKKYEGLVAKYEKLMKVNFEAYSKDNLNQVAYSRYVDAKENLEYYNSISAISLYADRKISKYETKIINLNSKLAGYFAYYEKKVKFANKQLDNLVKSHCSHIELLSRNNYKNYGKFNYYYKYLSNLQVEKTFMANIDKIAAAYTEGLKNYEAENTENERLSLEKTNEYNEKVIVADNNYKAIVDNKEYILKLIAEEKDAFKVKTTELKAQTTDKHKLNEQLETLKLEHKNKLARLDGRFNALPTDKLLKSMHKEELREAKHTFKRDMSFLSTKLTPEQVAKKSCIDFMLINYDFEYRYAQKCEKEIEKLISEQVDIAEYSKEGTELLDQKSNSFVSNFKSKFYGKNKSFKEQFKSLFNENFHITMLIIPIIGILFITIMPLFLSIFVAFTNYGVDANGVHHIIPYNLITWCGLDNFASLFAGTGKLAKLPAALLQTIGWTFIWAIFATFSNYILGIIFALLINKDGIKFKKLWRTIFVLTIAIPQFISLLCIAQLLKDTGVVGTWWFSTFGYRLGFGSSNVGNSVLITKIIIIIVNIWIGIPYTILSTTGILINIPRDLYESSRIDGAGPATQFFKITMPYILFVTGPYLITQFIGNVNNFGVIFFLTGGGPQMAGQALNVGQTDILITLIYKVVTDANQPRYGVASAIGIIVFIICSFVSIVMYNKTGAVQKEDQFQ